MAREVISKISATVGCTHYHKDKKKIVAFELGGVYPNYYYKDKEAYQCANDDIAYIPNCVLKQYNTEHSREVDSTNNVIPAEYVYSNQDCIKGSILYDFLSQSMEFYPDNPDYIFDEMFNGCTMEEAMGRI